MIKKNKARNQHKNILEKKQQGKKKNKTQLFIYGDATQKVKAT